ATPEQVKRIDALAVERYGLPEVALMETAGQQAALAIVSRWPKRAREGALIVCGKGNNGGDGMVVARHLAAAGVPVEVMLAGGTVGELSGAAAVMAAVWT